VVSTTTRFVRQAPPCNGFQNHYIDFCSKQTVAHSLLLSKSFASKANIDCGIGPAGWLSVAACASFFIAGMLLCGCPRPDPCVGNVCCQRKETQSSTTNDDDEEVPKVVPVVTQEEEPTKAKAESEPSDTEKLDTPAPGEAESNEEPELVPVITEKSQSVPLEDDQEELEGSLDSDHQIPEPQEGMGAEPGPEPVLMENAEEAEPQEDAQVEESQEEMGAESGSEPVLTENAEEPEPQEDAQVERPPKKRWWKRAA
jgi:hypothetical protein